MFKKPFTVKKNTNVRSSERKKFLSRLDDVVGTAIGKSQLAIATITGFTGNRMNLYVFERQPLFFEFDGENQLFPTVYLTWLTEAFCPVLYVHENVFEFLENGADLMLPGVLKSPSFPLPTIQANSPIAVSLLTSDGKIKGPVAIGRALMSSNDMIANRMQGRGVQMLHVLRDALWQFGSKVAPPVKQVQLKEASVTEEEAFPALGAEPVKKEVIEEVAEKVAEVALEDDEVEEQQEPNNNNSEEPTERQEDLLLRTFMAALIHRLTKSATFPYDVGQFYSNCLLKTIPEGKRLDMKKTKYKKFSTFLKEVNQLYKDGPILKITQKGKGNDVISEVNWWHPALKSFVVTDERITDEVVEKKAIGPVIWEYYAVTEPVVALLRHFGSVRKGDLLTVKQVRDAVTHYVKSQGRNMDKYVALDDVLRALVPTGAPDRMDWNTLMQHFFNKMTKTFVIRLPDGREIVKRAKIPLITFLVQKRAGNKVVTLVNNLDVYGFDFKDFCQKIQHGAAASVTTVNGEPNCEGPQVLVQGNQVAFIGDLLQETYGIDKAFIEGLNLAPKKKK
uniref:SUI1 domain-containing protein n=1 Tax=Steinernema glaseri TaxID=37863 RepID=A0A1I7YNW4_9BILA